jgi:ribosomal protein L23
MNSSQQAGTEGIFRTSEVIIETVQSMTKIEMKRLLEAVYGVEVEKVHSLNVLGKRRGDHTIMARKKNDFKRFYVHLSSPVDLPNVPKSIESLNAKPSSSGV